MSEIVSERSGNILRIQLNRPEKKNAMTSQMYVALAETLTGALHDDQIRVVLWHGAGNSFCAGNDIEDFLKNPPPSGGEGPQARLMKALVEFDKPLVAAVHGAVIGGGTTMVMHCDFVYAGESAKFQLPFVNLGVVPEFGSSYLIPALMGYMRASELILLGHSFGATRAAELGIVTSVTPDEKLLTTAMETAQQLAAKPTSALRACKQLLKQSARVSLEQAIRLENEKFAAQVRSADAHEALTAFLEKRSPDFTKTRS